MSLNKWKCRECGKITTEYDCICEQSDCDAERGLLRWLFHWNNPVVYLLLFPIGMFLAIIFLQP